MYITPCFYLVIIDSYTILRIVLEMDATMMYLNGPPPIEGTIEAGGIFVDLPFFSYLIILKGNQNIKLEKRSE